MPSYYTKQIERREKFSITFYDINLKEYPVITLTFVN